MTEQSRPNELIRGKTKILSDMPARPDCVEILETNRLTAGNGKRDEPCPGKGAVATQVNHHVMSLFRRAGLPVAYQEQTGENTRIDLKGSMIPLEVVAMRQVTKPSSIRKREFLPEGTRFADVRVAFFLKSKGPIFNGLALPDEDPLIYYHDSGGMFVCLPGKPISEDNKPVFLDGKTVYGERGSFPFEELRILITKGFLILEYAFHQLGWTLCDWKAEFAFLPDGRIVFADTGDPDSWRVVNEKGEHRDKQPFRENAPIETMVAIYQEIADRVRVFDDIDPSKLNL